MNPIWFAMKHPITTLMLVVGLIGGGAWRSIGMRVDIFPPLNEPRIYVFLQFGGMSPVQMEGLIVNQFELIFQYVDGVQEIESRSIQQVALIKLSFFPGTDMGAAEAEVVAMANRAMSRMPPGTLAAHDHAHGRGKRPGRLPGVSQQDDSAGPGGRLSPRTSSGRWCSPTCPAPWPSRRSGPNVRTILVKVDPQKLQAYNLQPQDVVNALMTGNVVIPAGNLYIKDQMPLVPTNALADDIQTLGNIPLKLGRNVYIRDVANISDGTDVDYGYALVDGQQVGLTCRSSRRTPPRR